MISPKPFVTGAVISAPGKLLLVKRSGNWCLPGGELAGGTDWLTSLRKTIEAGVGLNILFPRLLGVYADPHPGPEYFVTAVFLIKEYQGEIRLAEGADGFEWFSPDALPTPMPEAERLRARDALAFTGSVFVR